MTLFADASALVSMIAGETDADEMAHRMAPYRKRLCSAVANWETVAALCRSYGSAVPLARSLVRSFLAESDFEFVPVGEREFELAAHAYAKFGRGRHSAALNMGDCFAYACAKANGATLLFKGDDFGRTDIQVA